MECEEVRKILTTKKAFDPDPKIQEALEHLLKCDSCFLWTIKESEKLINEGKRE